MVERRAEEGHEPVESILTRDFIEGILLIAKKNLEQDRALAPMLFVHLKNGEVGVVSLDLPDTTEKKEAYFEALGGSLRQAGQHVDEAVFVSETWFVMAEQDQALTMDVAPSRHPRRKEAITLVGRNAERTRFTMVVQPFRREVDHQPIFESLAIEEYDVSPAEGMRPVGLLDYLFLNRMGRFSIN